MDHALKVELSGELQWIMLIVGDSLNLLVHSDWKQAPEW